MTNVIMNGAPFDADALPGAFRARTDAARETLEARLARKISASGRSVAGAAIETPGGKTAARDIVAGGAKAFAPGGGRFSELTRRSGSSSPARAASDGPAREAAKALARGLKQAALDALRKA